MAKIPPSIVESVRRFLEAVSQRYEVQAAYVFGSHARGVATRWSDIDVAVISSDFSEDLFKERLVLMRLSAHIDDRIEPCPFKTETFEVNDPLANEIHRHGIRVA